MTLGMATIIRADAAALPLADQSADWVVTSPPYWSLRSYEDGGVVLGGQIGAEPTPTEYTDSLIRCTGEWLRVLKPAGSLWVNLGDKYNAYNGNRGEGTLQSNRPRQSVERGHGLDVKTARPKSLLGLPWRYAIRCLDELGLILRAEVIWHKPNAMPESVRDRVRRSHEQWFHFVAQPRYYGDMTPLREPSNPANVRPADMRGDQSEVEAARRQRGHASVGHPGRELNYHPDGKLPGSVWSISTQPLQTPPHVKTRHFAAFPMEVPRRIISAWCPPGGVVLDPMGGAGTTALVAKALGRHGVSADLSEDYCRLARWRVDDPRQLARAVGRRIA